MIILNFSKKKTFNNHVCNYLNEFIAFFVGKPYQIRNPESGFYFILILFLFYFFLNDVLAEKIPKKSRRIIGEEKIL